MTTTQRRIKIHIHVSVDLAHRDKWHFNADYPDLDSAIQGLTALRDNLDVIVPEEEPPLCQRCGEPSERIDISTLDGTSPQYVWGHGCGDNGDAGSA